MNNHNNFYDPFTLFDEALDNALALMEAVTNKNPSNIKIYSNVPNSISKSLCGNNNPPSDIYEDNGDYHINFACAGYSEEDIEIEYDDGYITVKFNAPEEKEKNDEKVVYLKRGIKRSTEIVKLFIDTRKYDASKIEATLKDGIFSIVVPADEKFVKKFSIGINGKEPKAKKLEISNEVEGDSNNESDSEKEDE